MGLNGLRYPQPWEAREGIVGALLTLPHESERDRRHALQHHFFPVGQHSAKNADLNADLLT